MTIFRTENLRHLGILGIFTYFRRFLGIRNLLDFGTMGILEVWKIYASSAFWVFLPMEFTNFTKI